MKEVLEKVRAFADEAHGEQLRKYTPDRYIVHPVRVMEICRNYTNKVSVLAAALLHDVLEDTPVPKDTIQTFLTTLMGKDDASHAVNLVVELSDVYVKEAYPHLNRKKRKALEADRIKKTSAESQTIKYADIIDNCREIVKHDRHFAPVFLKECLLLIGIMDKGDKDLRDKANTLVKAELKLLWRR